MAYSEITYTGNGVTTLFSFPFTYLDQDHVSVSLNAVKQTSGYTFATASSIQFAVAPANGVAIRIWRDTPSDSLLANFTAGTAIREQDLELDLQQVLNISQETKLFAESQTNAGLQAQIDAANNTSNLALTTANAATVTANSATATANGIAATANTALSNSNSAVSTANSATSTANSASSAAAGAQATADAALPKAGGTMTGVITYAAAQPRLVMEATKATTSGASVDFTGIPSWAKRITLNMSGVSTTGTNLIVVRLGDAGGFENSGYLGSSCFVSGLPSYNSFNQSTGFNVVGGTASVAGVTMYGSLTLSVLEASTNTWACQGVIARGDTATVAMVGGVKALSDTLTQIQLANVGGTDTFDAGKANILYEG